MSDARQTGDIRRDILNLEIIVELPRHGAHAKARCVVLMVGAVPDSEFFELSLDVPLRKPSNRRSCHIRHALPVAAVAVDARFKQHLAAVRLCGSGRLQTARAQKRHACNDN